MSRKVKGFDPEELERKEMTVRQAVGNCIDLHTDEYSGYVESIRDRCSTLEGIVADLMQVLLDNALISAQQIEEIV